MYMKPIFSKTKLAEGETDLFLVIIAGRADLSPLNSGNQVFLTNLHSASPTTFRMRIEQLLLHLECSVDDPDPARSETFCLSGSGS
jgi:hypothetical protein